MNRTALRVVVASTVSLLALGGVAATPAHAAPASAVVDTDHDLMPDSWERANHLNPRRNDAKEDPDHDGLGNLNDMKLHGRPHDPDTDNDGSDDGDERRDHTVVDRMDSDRDGRRDGNEDRDHDGVTNEDEDDALEDCLHDDADTDHDGIADEDEDELHTNVNVADTDHDGVRDGDEDRDHDGRSNEDEDDHEADRCHHDGDHDGIDDEDEADFFGTIASFDASTGVLAITTADGPVTVTVTADTRIRYDDDADEAATAPLAVDDQGRGGSGGGGTDDEPGDDHGGRTTVDALQPGVGVAEVEFHHGVLERVELIRPVTSA